jgi:hypothetical protein
MSDVKTGRFARALTAAMLVGALAACAPAATQPAAGAHSAAAPSSAADLGAIKAYLLDKGAQLSASAARLAETAGRYHAFAATAGGDYRALWEQRGADVARLIEEARAEWVAASPLYEQMEGIVAGVPSLARYDVILDSGASAEEGGDNVAPVDLALPDGRTLARPGNLFGVTESALWGTHEAFTVPGIETDFDGDGQAEFGERLPDPHILKAGADALSRACAELLESARQWTPTETDAFTALVVMVPTMSEYFEAWKNSRFVIGDQSTQRDFVAISRLADIQDILASLQVVHQGIRPLIQAVDAAQDRSIGEELSDLKSFVARVHGEERDGKRFTPEEADVLGAEAQNRATAITGQIAQIAARLSIDVEP